MVHHVLLPTHTQLHHTHRESRGVRHCTHTVTGTSSVCDTGNIPNTETELMQQNVRVAVTHGHSQCTACTQVHAACELQVCTQTHTQMHTAVLRCVSSYTQHYSRAVIHTNPHTTPHPWAYTLPQAGCSQHSAGPSHTHVPPPSPTEDAQMSPRPQTAIHTPTCLCSQLPGWRRALE